MSLDYEHNGAAIYTASFATIRRETDLSRVPASAERLAVRMVHACGMTDLVDDIAVTDDLVSSARSALTAGAPVLCDSVMVAAGVTASRLPARNPVICTLRDPDVPSLATRLGTTRSAAALELWRDDLAGAVVAIGNAPTALFHLLEMIAAGAPRPAAIVGVPVGFIGAAESKRALADSALRLPHVVVHGRRGGSAIASAAINALASDAE